MDGQNVMPYEYTILHSNYTNLNPEEVKVIVRVDEPGFRTDNHERCCVAVTLEDRFIEVLIYEKNRNGKVIRRFKCVERTSPYDTDNFTIRRQSNAVVLTLRKRSEEPWSATPFSG